LLSKFNNLNLNIHEISKLLGRGKRSGIGVETFSSGGFVVDSGKKKGSKFPPSKILRINWPKDWNIILLSDTNLEGLSGKKEQQEFSNLKKLTLNYVEENCFNVLMRIIPGIVEKDFNTFVTGIQKIQNNMSKIFYGSSQSFSSKGISSIFKLLKSQKILGYGQSSWGPTGFIFCKNLKEKKKLLQKIEKFIEFKKIKGINLVNVNGRNFGNTLKKSN
jgi:beta-RFAP synthase